LCSVTGPDVRENMGARGLDILMKPNHPVIGCDVHGKVVRVVQLQNEGPSSIRAMGQCALDTPNTAPEKPTASQLAGLAETLNTAHCSGKHVVIPAHPAWVQIQEIELAPMEEDAMKSAAHWQFCSQLGLAADETVSDFSIVSAPGSKRLHAIAFGMPSNIAYAWDSAFSDAGLHLAGIDLSTYALSRYLSQFCMNDRDAKPTLILDFNPNKSFVSIVANHQVRFFRGLNTAQANAAQMISKTMGLPEDEADSYIRAIRQGEALPGGIDIQRLDTLLERSDREMLQSLTRELMLCLQHLRRIDRDVNPQQLVISGQTFSPQHTRVLAESLHLEVRTPTPNESQLVTSDATKDFTDNPTPWGLAIGLAAYDHITESSMEVAA